MSAPAPPPHFTQPGGPRAIPKDRFPRPVKPYPHLRDLVTRAECEVDSNATIRKLVERATNALKQAQTSLEFKRPDHAYTEFLIASMIVLDIIPKHKDAPTLDAHTLRELMQRINSNQGKYEEAKTAITEDNKFNQTPAKSTPQSTMHANVKSSQNKSDQRPTSLRFSQAPNSYGVSNQSFPQFRSSTAENHFNNFSRYDATQPINGKRNSSVASPSSTSKNTSEVIEERFSRLRMTGSSYANGTQYAAHANPPRISQSSLSIISKELPKPPSPTYSPSRSTGRGPPAARVSKSSVSSSADRPSSSASSTGSIYVNGLPNKSVPQDKVLEGQAPSQVHEHRRRKSVNAPRETEVPANRLFDYLNTFRILVIDVRSREEYDAGHISAQYSMCVEPVILRPNMSARQLREAMVLSPEKEQEMFDRRDEFDLIVFHSQSVASTKNFRTKLYGSPDPLNYLYDALYEFNDERPLRYPPALLSGGLDAWVDLVGKRALATSNTAALKLQNTSPAIARQTTASSARLNLQKNRHRDYNPLDPEEERKWRAKAKIAVVGQHPQALPDSAVNVDDIDRTDYPSAKQDVLDRYPDVASVEERVLASAVPLRPPPEPPRIPVYPAAPTPSIPSRPPPALPRKSYSGVSERLTSPNSSSAKNQLAAYIPPHLTRVPRIGLHNFGVTCYMNATIQCLSATIDLTTFFLDGNWSRYVQENNWKGSKGIIPNFYFVLLRNLWLSKDIDTIRPTNFRKFCARLNKEWGLDRQQDAKEFLEFLLDCLHEDFNTNWARPPLAPLTTEAEAQQEKMPPFIASKREWERYLHRASSYITELFGGQHISRLQCTTCHHSSTTYEPFYSVSVEIPTPSPAQHGVVDIRDCLRSYCSDERLSGDEVWKCPRCRKEREAIKRITISRAPKILVVHFKRFSAGHSERARKIHTPVKFPLRGFDLGPFMLSPPDKNQLTGEYPQSDLRSPTSMSPPYKYDAYAIMRHIGGTMMSGHYTSLVQDQARGCWREFNDDRVEDFQPEGLPPSKGLQNEQAYIVFFRRVLG